MEEKIVSKEELIQLFEDQKLLDTGKGWMMGDREVQIIALHEVDPKFLQDITNAKFYKLTPKEGK
ncbi:hypothetical protein [Halarcobacter sp.]|uniref:hypothetical protein n=1 Tax=Halarcobacter sp. TaxID=2321133 RepID=UPI0029F5680D|nr:hypothetical protein [Halarcobacter sp.]